MENVDSEESGHPPPPGKLPPIAALLLSGIANLKYAITGKSSDLPPPGKLPPIAALLLSGTADLKYAITGKPGFPKSNRL